MATAEWLQMSGRNCYYRKQMLYEMVWSERIDFSQMIVCGAPFGGPIAVVNDPNSRKLLTKMQHTKHDDRRLLRIFSSSGVPISQTLFDHKVSKIGWAEKESLVCVLDDGQVQIYNIHCELIKSFSLGAAFKTDPLGDCIIWSTGLIARTGGSFNFVAVTNFDQPKPSPLPKLNVNKPPRCMTVVENNTFSNLTEPDSISSRIQVLVSTGEGPIMVLQESKWREINLSAGKIGAVEKISASPDGKKLALFGDLGSVALVSSNFQECFSVSSMKIKIPPTDMVWCGNEAVLCYWQNTSPLTVLLIDQSGDYINYEFDETMLHFVLECDGVRIISPLACEFLQKVPESTRSVFEIGSVSPAAMLYDATEAFETRSAKADEIIRGINGSEDLESAVFACLDAAGSEVDLVYQARLLKAASYGKLFLEEFDHDFFTKTCKEIRVLNSIRYFRIGIPLTIEEYNKLGDHALVERLTHRNLHLLALRVCEYLKLSPNSVLIHWASSKLESSTSLSDESLAKTIVSKLEMYPGISYAEIATSAFRSGRLKLATLLLEKEPRAADQVRLLMSMKSNETALDKAMESLDTDLIFLVILGTLLRDEKELFRMLEHNSIATNLFISYCTASQKSEDHAVLKRFFFYLNRPAEAADHKILEGYKQQRFSDRTKFLELAKQFYEEEKQDEFAAKCVEEQIALLDIQRSREVKVDPSLVNAIAVENKRSAKAIFMDLSVSQMIEQYLVTDRQKDAEKLAKQFKVPVKRYTHIQVKAFSKSRKWEDLFRIFKGTKSPIGIIPFIDACLEQKNIYEASRYIKKLPETAEQMEWLCNIGLWKEAVDVANAEKNIDALKTISAACSDKHVQLLVAEKLRILQSR